MEINTENHLSHPKTMEESFEEVSAHKCIIMVSKNPV